MGEDEPQLLLRIGFDNLLDLSDCFKVALTDVVEGTARNTDLSTSIYDGHAVVHALDDLEGSVVPRGFG
jgi:hypothetical protein